MAYGFFVAVKLNHEPPKSRWFFVAIARLPPENMLAPLWRPVKKSLMYCNCAGERYVVAFGAGRYASSAPAAMVTKDWTSDGRPVNWLDKNELIVADEMACAAPPVPLRYASAPVAVV